MVLKTFRKEYLYTIIVDYRRNTYIEQVFAKDEMDAQLQWVKKIDLNKMRVPGIKKTRNQLVAEATDPDDRPGLLNGTQFVWCASIIEFSDQDAYELGCAIANIIATKSLEKNNEITLAISEKVVKNNLKFSKNKSLYTIQLDYKGGCYIHQVLVDTPIEAKIQWLKGFDFNVVSGIPENIQAIKEDLLAHSTDQDFMPKSVENMDSVWSTTVPLSDESGRVTIVATQTNVVELKRDAI